MRPRWFLLVLLAVSLLCFGTSVALYNFPPVYRQIDGYLAGYRQRVHRVLDPAQEAACLPPEQQEQIEAIVQATLQALVWTPELPGQPAAQSVPTETPLPTATPLPSPSPTPAPTSVPAFVELTGVRNEVETRNNCGPATLAMALSYWDWQGDQSTIRAVLRPNEQVDDKNVMPAELARYAQHNSGLQALVRVGGDVDLLKRLIAAGFPVIVEKGHITTGWIGHYILLTGYDDAQGHFLSQDSLIVSPGVPVPYDELQKWWQHFNYLYLVLYPAEQEAEVLAILGPRADVHANYQYAAEKARQEIPRLEGRALFFGWYNLGSSLTGLGDTAGAVQAFDAAYGEVYPNLKKEERPWRALWYQTDPYLAYYSAGRYEDVIDLANTTLEATGSPVLEESLYWRGMAREALGDLEGAISDYRKAARLNPNSTPALERLQQLEN